MIPFCDRCGWWAAGDCTCPGDALEAARRAAVARARHAEAVQLARHLDALAAAGHDEQEAA